MSIRDGLRAMIAAHTPAGGNVQARTRAFMQKLISHYYPKSVPVNVDTLPVCDWDDASEWVYVDTPHAIVINSQVTPLHYGMRLGADMAREMRDAGMLLVPINPNLPPRHEVVASEPHDAVVEGVTPSPRPRGRSPKRRPAIAGV